MSGEIKFSETHEGHYLERLDWDNSVERDTYNAWCSPRSLNRFLSEEKVADMFAGLSTNKFFHLKSGGELAAARIVSLHNPYDRYIMSRNWIYNLQKATGIPFYSAQIILSKSENPFREGVADIKEFNVYGRLSSEVSQTGDFVYGGEASFTPKKFAKFLYSMSCEEEKGCPIQKFLHIRKTIVKEEEGHGKSTN